MIFTKKFDTQFFINANLFKEFFLRTMQYGSGNLSFWFQIPISTKCYLKHIWKFFDAKLQDMI